MKIFSKILCIVSVIICLSLFLAVNVFALDDLTIVESSMHALGSSSKFTRTKLTSGNIYGYKLTGTDYIYKWEPIDLTETSKYIFQDKTHGVSAEKINEYSYLVYRTNFVSENIESFYLATASSKQVSTLVTSDNWQNERWNNLTFVCVIDKENTDSTKVCLEDIICYINGKEIEIEYNLNPFAEADNQVEFRITFNVKNGVENASLYMGKHQIYATDSIPQISMPAFTEDVRYDDTVNMVWFSDTTMVKEVAINEGHQINAYINGDFENARTPSQILESYDLITIKGTDFSLSYYTVIIGDRECQLYDDKGELLKSENSQLVGGYKGKQENDFSYVTDSGDEEIIVSAQLFNDIVPKGYEYFYLDMLFAPDNLNYNIAIGDLTLDGGLKCGKWNSLRFVYDLENKTVLSYINGVNIDTQGFDNLPDIIEVKFSSTAAFDEIHSYYSTNLPDDKVIPSLTGGKIKDDEVFVNSYATDKLTGLNGLLTVYTDDTFSQIVDCDENVADGNIVVLQSQDDVFAYYTVSDMYIISETMQSGWVYSNNITKIDKLNNIVLNDAQAGVEISKNSKGYIEFENLPSEVWNYFVLDFDALKTGDIELCLSNRDKALIKAGNVVPEMEWCKISYVLSLSDNTYKMFVDGGKVEEGELNDFDFLNFVPRLEFNNISSENLSFYIDNMKLYFSNTSPDIVKINKPSGIDLKNGLYDEKTLFLNQNIYSANAMTAQNLKDEFGAAIIIDADTYAQTNSDDKLSLAYLVFENSDGIKTYKFLSVEDKNIIISDDKDKNVYAHSEEASSFIAASVMDKHIKDVKVVPVIKGKFSKIEALHSDDNTFIKCMLWNKNTLVPLTEFCEFKGIFK